MPMLRIKSENKPKGNICSRLIGGDKRDDGRMAERGTK